MTDFLLQNPQRRAIIHRWSDIILYAVTGACVGLLFLHLISPIIADWIVSTLALHHIPDDTLSWLAWPWHLLQVIALCIFFKQVLQNQRAHLTNSYYPSLLWSAYSSLLLLSVFLFFNWTTNIFYTSNKVPVEACLISFITFSVALLAILIINTQTSALKETDNKSAKDPIATPEDDLFKRSELASVIAKRLKDSVTKDSPKTNEYPESLTILGGFGSGKTSFVNLIQWHIEKTPHKDTDTHKPSFVFCYIPTWGFKDSETTQKTILQHALKKLNETSDTFAFQDTPYRYLKATGQTLGRSYPLLQVILDFIRPELTPIESLERLHSLLAANHQYLVLVIEDADRNGDQSIQGLVAFLDQVKEAKRLCFILTAKEQYQTDLTRLTTWQLMLPPISAKQENEYLGKSLRRICLSTSRELFRNTPKWKDTLKILKDYSTPQDRYTLLTALNEALPHIRSKVDFIEHVKKAWNENHSWLLERRIDFRFFAAHEALKLLNPQLLLWIGEHHQELKFLAIYKELEPGLQKLKEPLATSSNHAQVETALFQIHSLDRYSDKKTFSATTQLAINLCGDVARNFYNSEGARNQKQNQMLDDRVFHYHTNLISLLSESLAANRNQFDENYRQFIRLHQKEEPTEIDEEIIEAYWTAKTVSANSNNVHSEEFINSKLKEEADENLKMFFTSVNQLFGLNNHSIEDNSYVESVLSSGNNTRTEAPRLKARILQHKEA